MEIAFRVGRSGCAKRDRAVQKKNCNVQRRSVLCEGRSRSAKGDRAMRRDIALCIERIALCTEEACCAKVDLAVQEEISFFEDALRCASSDRVDRDESASCAVNATGAVIALGTGVELGANTHRAPHYGAGKNSSGIMLIVLIAKTKCETCANYTGKEGKK